MIYMININTEIFLRSVKDLNKPKIRNYHPIHD